MKRNLTLVITSLLSILLLTLHVTDDIVRGISKPEPANLALLVLVVWLYGTLLLAERRSGHIIMLLVGLFAAGMPVIHMRGVHYPDIAASSGGFFFVWTHGSSVSAIVVGANSSRGPPSNQRSTTTGPLVFAPRQTTDVSEMPTDGSSISSTSRATKPDDAISPSFEMAAGPL